MCVNYVWNDDIVGCRLCKSYDFPKESQIHNIVVVHSSTLKEKESLLFLLSRSWTLLHEKCMHYTFVMRPLLDHNTQNGCHLKKDIHFHPNMKFSYFSSSRTCQIAEHIPFFFHYIESFSLENNGNAYIHLCACTCCCCFQTFPYPLPFYSPYLQASNNLATCMIPCCPEQ